MSLVWIAIGVGAAVWGAMQLWLKSGAAGSDTLGTVSEHWLAEHRLDRTESHR